jgi:DNA-binding CsgD family transcriptional regulator
MPASALRLRDLRAIYELVHECRDLGDDPDGWQRHYSARLSALTGADLAFGGELAGLKGGRPRPLGAAEWGWERGFDRRYWLRSCELLATDPTYPKIFHGYSRRLVHEDGIALSRTEVVEEATWERSTECQEVYRPTNVRDGLYCFRSISGTVDEVSGTMLFRAAGGRDFSPREKAVVREAQALVVALVGRALSRFNEPSAADLAPRVREVLRCLLEGDSDKQIAARLEISKYTVNQYVKVIFNHFGVTTRTELLARWIRRGWGNGFSWANAHAPE